MGLSDKIEANVEQMVQGASGRIREAGNYLRKEMKATLSVKGTPDSPSAPGEPPRKQSGTLFNSIWLTVSKSGFSVGSGCKYAKFLEKGTRRMAARPWFQATIDRTRDQVRKILYGK